MFLKSFFCPNCGTNLKVDGSLKVCFCENCGTRISLDEEGGQVATPQRPNPVSTFAPPYQPRPSGGGNGSMMGVCAAILIVAVGIGGYMFISSDDRGSNGDSSSSITQNQKTASNSAKKQWGNSTINTTRNLLDVPSEQHGNEIVGTWPGMPFNVTQRVENYLGEIWYMGTTENGHEVYAPEHSVSLSPGALSPASSDRTRGMINDNNTNVRNRPGTQGSRVVGVVNRGQMVTVNLKLFDNNGSPWYEIEYNGKRVYITAPYVDILR